MIIVGAKSYTIKEMIQLKAPDSTKCSKHWSAIEDILLWKKPKKRHKRHVLDETFYETA